MNRYLAFALLALAITEPASAQRTPILSPQPLPSDITPGVDPSRCGNFTGHWGPIDYRTADPRDIRLVEGSHLDMETKTFLSGRVEGRNTAGTGGVAGGFQYTLKAFPNHWRALLLMDQLGRRLKSEQPQGTDVRLECWYLRAFMYAPDDPAVRATYGVYLAHRGRRDEAAHNLDIADQAFADNGAMQNLIGTANVVLQRYERAQLNAMRAARVGFPTDTVAQRVKKAGKWNPELKLPEESGAGAAEPKASGTN